MDDYTKETIKTYDKFAKKYEENNAVKTENELEKEISLFLENVEGKKILDLGSGPGNISLIFRNKGFEPLCVDFSGEMIKLCKEKGLNAVQSNIEELNLSESFGGIWANASLLHISKNNLPSVIQNVYDLLLPKGVFFIGMKEGDFEGYEFREHYPEVKRYFSYYKKEELEKILRKLFDIIYFREINFRKRNYLIFLCKKA